MGSWIIQTHDSSKILLHVQKERHETMHEDRPEQSPSIISLKVHKIEIFLASILKFVLFLC